MQMSAQRQSLHGYTHSRKMRKFIRVAIDAGTVVMSKLKRATEASQREQPVKAIQK